MRLSITLDPDLHQIASARARARRVSLSKEINTLLRAAVSPAPQPASPRPPTATSDSPDPSRHTLDPLTGLLVSHGRRQFSVSPGKPDLTLEDFQRMEDDDDLRHLENHPKD